MENPANHLIFSDKQIEKNLFRLAAQLYELSKYNPDLKILSIQPRGFLLANAHLELLCKKFNLVLPLGTIDPSFHLE